MLDLSFNVFRLIHKEGFQLCQTGAGGSEGGQGLLTLMEQLLLFQASNDHSFAHRLPFFSVELNESPRNGEGQIHGGELDISGKEDAIGGLLPSSPLPKENDKSQKDDQHKDGDEYLLVGPH